MAMTHEVEIKVIVQLERTRGVLVSKEEIANDIIEAIEGVVDRYEFDVDGSQYDVTDSTVEQVV